MLQLGLLTVTHAVLLQRCQQVNLNLLGFDIARTYDVTLSNVQNVSHKTTKVVGLGGFNIANPCVC